MQVTTWTLEMRDPNALVGVKHELPADFTIHESRSVTPEFARYLYALVGGPWRWTDRLAWSRQQWVDDLSTPATVFLIAYRDAVPQGYLQLQASSIGETSDIEIKYFGLAETAIGRGVGSALLTRGIECAWHLGDSGEIPPVGRVWVHTCSLDGPAALPTYQARGLRLIDETVTDEDYPQQPLGAWVSTGGPA